MASLKSIWGDESGVIISAELILLMTICGIGLICGMVVLRNAVVTELADVANAVEAMNISDSSSTTTESVGISLVEPPTAEAPE